MDQVLTSGLISSLSEGDLVGFVKFLAIFVFIWLQIKGLKKEVRNLASSISVSFDSGEKRFTNLEKLQLEFEHRLTVLEQNPQGG